MADPTTTPPSKNPPDKGALSARMEVVATALGNFAPWLKEAAEVLYQGDVRAQEINAALGVAQGENQLLRDELDSVRAQLAESQASCEALKAQLKGGAAGDVKRLAAEKDLLAKQNAQLTGQLRDVQFELELLKKQTTIDSPEVAQLRQRVQSLQEENTSLKEARGRMMKVVQASARTQQKK